MYRTFINRPTFAIVLSLMILLLGGLSLAHLPVEQYPNISPPVVEVSANYLGADASEVNDAVATPLSEAVMGTDGVLYTQSTSASDGSMHLNILFEVGSDANMDQIFAQNNIATATPLLPAAVTQQGITTRKTESGFLLVYALYSDGRYGSDFLSNYAYINLRNELLRIDGVGKVEILGAGEYSMRIWVKPDLLDYYGISIDQIASAIESQSTTFPAGKFGEEPQTNPTEFTYTVTLPAEISTPEEYSQIIVKTMPDGQRLTLGEVARVEFGVQSYGINSEFNGKPSALVTIYQTPGSNAVSVGRQVGETMAELANDFPSGMEYASVVDATTTIREGVREILLTLLFALLLVVLIIYLFLQDWRATLIPIVAIPVSLIGAFILFPFFGFSINIITLLGLILAIGLVVDDAIIVVEATQVRMEQGLDSRRATALAMKSVASPIVATTIVLLAVFIPISFIGGVAGRLFQQFAMAISAAVVISAFNALSLSPALCALLLRKRHPSERGLLSKLGSIYRRSVESYTRFSSIVVRHAGRSLLLIGVAAIAIFAISRLLPSGFLPTEDQGYLMVSVTTPEAASVSRTREAIAQAGAVIARQDGVAAQASTAGFDMLAGVASTNSGIIFVTLSPFSERRLSAEQIATQLGSKLSAEVGEGLFYVLEPPAIAGLGVTGDITFMLQDRNGAGLDYLAAQGDSLRTLVANLREVSSLNTTFNAYVPQRMLLIDNELAMQQGVSLDELHTLLSTYLGGSYISNFNRFGQLYRTYIQAEADYRRDSRSLADYYLTSADGESLSLQNFVRVVDTVGVEAITRFNLYDAIPFTATPAPGYSTSQAMDALQHVVDEQMPENISLAWSGISYQEAANTSGRWVTYLLAAVFIFLTLAALYDSWALPLSVLLGVPFAILGAMLALWVAHLISPLYTDNIYLNISLVMLISLAAKNAILVVEHADRLFFDEGRTLFEAALGAARSRVRPIVMTALAFIIGVMPLLFASGAYATARRVMGLALFGGMTMATVLGIFIYPALYYLVGRWSHMERRRERKARQTTI